MQIRSFWPQWDLGEKAGGDSSGEYYRLYNREEGADPKEAMMLVIDIPQDPAETAGLRSAGLDADGIRVYYDKKAREIVRNTGRFMHMRKGDTILPVRACDYEPHTDGPGMRIYVLMDRLAGLEPFMESVSEDGHADPWAVVCLAADLCGALEYCAENGMVHGGIRPSAVFVREDGTFMLGSFDLSGRHIAAGNEPFSINELSLYMAPEQASGAARNGQTDLYSAAMIIYRYFNHGRLPFYPLWPDPVSPADMMRAQTRRMQGTPVPGPDDTDPQMAEILKKACDPDPEKRYESAADLRAAILHWAWDHNYLHIAPGGRKEEEGDHYDRLTERYVLNPDTVPGAERMPDMSACRTCQTFPPDCGKPGRRKRSCLRRRMEKHRQKTSGTTPSCCTGWTSSTTPDSPAVCILPRRNGWRWKARSRRSSPGKRERRKRQPFPEKNAQTKRSAGYAAKTADCGSRSFSFCCSP